MNLEASLPNVEGLSEDVRLGEAFFFLGRSTVGAIRVMLAIPFLFLRFDFDSHRKR